MDIRKDFASKTAELTAHHGGIASLAAASGCRAQDWRRWGAGSVPSRRCRGRVQAAFEAAGIRSPWASRCGEAVPLFDLQTFQPTVWVEISKAVVERLEDAMFCRYSLSEDHGYQVVLRDESVQGGTLTTWRVVSYATRSYALRLPDGRLLEYVSGSAIPLIEDTEARRRARARSKTQQQRGLRSVA
jgi:hypothetical protein